MKKIHGLFVLLILFSFILAGCGGAGEKNISLNMREFSFSPEEFSVTAGTEVTLNMKNLGSLGHNFHIMKMGADVEEKWEDEDEQATLLDVEILDGGDNTSVTFTAPTEPGTYQIVCSIPGHFEQGMVGTMVVTAP